MVGRTISHYRIVGHLGAGGMGVVYSAEDLRLGRPVALKFVSEDLASEPHAIGRLRSEARATSALNHPNICTIYDIDDHEGQPFIVMELMKGRTLRDRLSGGPLKIHQLVDIGTDIADALQAAHAAGIVHRDIKPGNIFLTDGGRVKVLDFGLAKLLPQPASSSTTRSPTDPTGAGLTPGTISYMSPEQATGEELDARTDLFSLGVVLYECATGRHPFPGKTSTAILAAILNRAPVAPAALNQELPLRLQDVINNCLEKDRELRYQSAADLRADLKRVRRDLESGRSRAGEMVSGIAGPRSDGTARRERESDAISGGAGSRDRDLAPAGARSRLSVVAAVAGAFAIVAAGSYALWRVTPAPASPPASEVGGMQDVAQDRPAAGDSRPASPAASPAGPSAELLARAEARLKGRDYQAALGFAEDVLSQNAGHEGAIRIRDEARAMMRRRDAAISEARRHVAAGDLTRAARALDTARGIDPAASGLSEISSLLAELARQRASARAPTLSAQQGPGTIIQSGPVAPPPAAAASQSAPIRAQPGAEPTPVLPVPAPPAPQPTVPAAPQPPPAAPATSSGPPSTPSQPAATERPNTEPAAPSADEEEAAIRHVTTSYGRAIENKDMALFRAIKPNLSREEERRLEDGFRAVTTQRVGLTIQSIAVRGEQATVQLMRRDTIQAGGRPQTTQSQQTLTLARTRSGWVIVDIR